jgi:hypothetical protein
MFYSVTALQKLPLLVSVMCQLHERDFHMKSFVIVCEILWQSFTHFSIILLVVGSAVCTTE